MKPPQFEYADPASTDEALDLLAQHGADGKVLAGGQSFVPLLNYRIARPEMVIDINRIGELSGLDSSNGSLKIGALTRQQQLLVNENVRQRWPLLTEAAGFIGHRTIRNRGTVGGSLVHADPSAELPAVAVALDAEMHVRSKDGERTIAAKDFFVDYLTTAIEPEELLVDITFPAVPARTGTAFMEVSRRHGDFSMVAVVALITLDESGNTSVARLTLAGVDAAPFDADISGALSGRTPSEELIREAVVAGLADLSPIADHHASAEYRKSVAETLSRRALIAASERAREGGNA